jgi:hypothetical protein
VNHGILFLQQEVQMLPVSAGQVKVITVANRLAAVGLLLKADGSLQPLSAKI